MDLSVVAKFKADKDKNIQEDFQDGQLSYKRLRGTPCDPNYSIIVSIYSRKTTKIRRQALKRKNMIDRLCFYMGIDGMKHTGKIVAFYSKTGAMVLVSKDKVQPADDPQLVFIE